MLDNITQVISIIIAAVGALGTITTLIIKYIQKTKQYIEEKNWTALFNEIKPLVSAAEEIMNFQGNDKKEWVLTKLNQVAINKGLTFDIQKVSKAIEDVVDLTKKVNKRDKDTSVTPVTPPAETIPSPTTPQA